MNCFQLIKKVLDETYNDVDGNHDHKDKQIKEQLLKLSQEYRDIPSGLDLDYHMPACRFAYIHRYVTCHANIVYEIICSSEELKKLFEKESVSISCVGGGPGSDLLGIIKYVDVFRSKTHIQCFLLDRQKLWNECWCDLDENVSTECRLSTNFMQLDVLDQSSWQGHTKHMRADLFTMIYFLSEVWNEKEIAQGYLNHLFTNMKEGSYILFVDNNNDRFFGWFDGMVEANGLRVILSDRREMQLPIDEEKRDLGMYFDKFGHPKLGANIAYRLVQKI